MRFLDPAFLWGLLAVAVPVALHLLLRRRIAVLDFPLARLVARAEISRQPRKRLNRVLLLLARAAMLALLALGLARVTLGGGEAVAAAGPVAAVVVVDDSLSLSARAEGGGTILERGLDAAGSFVAALPEGSRIAVIVAGPPREEPPELGSPAAARAALARVRPCLAHVALEPFVREALGLLAAAPQPDRRLVIVSDLARHALEGMSLPRWSDLAGAGGAGDAPPRLVTLSPRREEGPNFSVAGLEADTLPGGRLRVTARIAAWGLERAGQTRLTARTGAAEGDLREVLRANLPVGAGASAERRFDIAAPAPGFGRTLVEIGEDVLPADDTRAAAHHVSARASVLVVDGDPQNLAIASETFYLEKALAPEVGLGVPADIVPLSGLSEETVKDRAVIMTCNVRELSRARAQALSDAVRAGAGLVVAMGNRVDVAALSASLGDLLPARLGLPRAATPPATLVTMRSERPAPGMSLPDLSRVAVRQHVLLEPLPDARVLLRLSSGEPLLVEREAGRGRVLVLGTTLDRDWTDLPISPAYLTFLQALVERASPPSQSRVLPESLVGAPAALRGLADGGPVTVRRPDGESADLPAGAQAFTDTFVPGVHAVLDGGRIVAMFSVVTDPAESDLSRMTPDELGVALAGSVEAGRAVAGGESSGRPAWPVLLGLLVAACAAEAWLARRSA